MKNIDAKKQARIDIIETLASAGMMQGITLSDNDFAKSNTITFWHGVVRDERVRQKDAYITYHFPSSDANTRADNQVMLRDVVVAVDLFSKRSFDSEQNYMLLEKLEMAFMQGGYEVEFGDEQYETDTKLFHYPMTLFKLY